MKTKTGSGILPMFVLTLFILIIGATGGILIFDQIQEYQNLLQNRLDQSISNSGLIPCFPNHP